MVRLFTRMKSIVNFACMETSLKIKNPFAVLYLYREQGIGTQANLRACDQNEYRRSASVLMIRCGGQQRFYQTHACDCWSDGARNHGHPFGSRDSLIDLKPHPWRRLKTESSARRVPLAGAALWAAKRICKRGLSVYSFPSHNRGDACLSHSASGALNKWLKEVCAAWLHRS